MDESSTVESNDGGDRKRRRVALACSACRTRKSKCDGIRPRCSSCSQLGFDCIYVQSAASSNVIVGKEYLGGLENRLRSVENMLGTLFENLRDPTSGSSRSRMPLMMPATGTLSEQLRTDTNDDEDEEGDADSALVFAAEGRDGFFGPSSNISLTRHVAKAVAQLPRNNVTGSSFFDSGPIDTPVSTEHSIAIQNVVDRNEMFALPPRDKLRRLVDRYFQWTSLIYPYVHRQTFMDVLAEVEQNNFSRVRRTWMGMLNMILALTTNITTRNDDVGRDRTAECALYYRRALTLCDTDILRGTSLELVQYLLLMGQYLQGTQNSIKTWNIHGLAVKAAFQLGLHSSDASKSFSPLEREVRKRTWYGCVMLDRTLSMTFGRPSAIPNHYLKLEKAMPYPAPVSDVTDSAELLSVDFFNATIDLYCIMWKTIDQLYGSNLACGETVLTADMASTMVQLDQDVTIWECGLSKAMMPMKAQDFIQLTLSGPQELKQYRFKTILTLRKCNVQLLVYRPLLIRLLQYDEQPPQSEAHSNEGQLLMRLSQNCIQNAAQSALEVVSIAHSNLLFHSTERSSLLGAWWYTLYYTFNASLIIVVILLVHNKPAFRSQISDSLDVSQARRTLNDAIAAINTLDVGSKVPTKCVEYLTRLLRTIDSSAHDTNQQWDPSQNLTTPTSCNAWSGPPLSADNQEAPSDFTLGDNFDWDSFLTQTGQEFFADLS